MADLNETPALHPAASIGVFVATVFLGFVVIGPLIGFLLALPFYEGTFLQLAENITKGQPSEDIKTPFLIMQASASGVGLIVVPMLAYRFMVHEKVTALFNPVKATWAVITAMAVITFMFPNSAVIDWNSSLDFKTDFWVWARQREDLAAGFVKFITTFNSPLEFAVGVLVIAVLPALGEEFTFRGWLQPAIQKASGNAHVAIWVSAFLFSALHMQFFGFVPRMLLGGLFGYLMHWSGNLWIPVIAHFVNNGFTVLMLYLNQQGVVAFDVEAPEALPWMAIVPGTIIFVGILVLLKKQLATRE